MMPTPLTPRHQVNPEEANLISVALDPQLLRVAGVVVLGALMSILDTTIVNVAIRGLSAAFHSPLVTTQWISTGYLLALTAIIPLSGWAADRFGTKRLYLVSIALFMAGSALAGSAWSMESLIAFRVLQGLGGGMILPIGMTLLGHAAGPRRMGRVMGMVGIPVVLGPILGPALGGWLVDDISWRWIFFINLPIGALALLAACRVLASDEPKPHHALDWRGLLLLSPGLAVFIYGLAEATARGSFASPGGAGWVAVGLAMIVAFVLHAWRRDDALIDVRLFMHRPVAAAAGVTVLLGAAFFGVALLLPLYFQLVRGHSAFATGMLMAAEGVGAVLIMPMASRLTDRIGAKRVVLTGIGCIAGAVLLMGTMNDVTPLWMIEAALVVIGVGKGATMMPATSAALSSLQRHQIARATSGLNVLQRAGGALGTAWLAVMLAHGMVGLGVEGGLGGLDGNAPVGVLQQSAAPWLGQVFGHAFLWSLGLVLLAAGAAVYLGSLPATPGKRVDSAT